MEDGEAVTGEQGLKGSQAEIEHVFVIDGVEFGVLDKIHRIREFEDNPAFWFQ